MFAMLLIFAVMPPQFPDRPKVLPPQFPAPTIGAGCIDRGCGCGCLEGYRCPCSPGPLLPHKTYAEWRTAALKRRGLAPRPVIIRPAAFAPVFMPSFANSFSGGFRGASCSGGG